MVAQRTLRFYHHQHDEATGRMKVHYDSGDSNARKRKRNNEAQRRKRANTRLRRSVDPNTVPTPNPMAPPTLALDVAKASALASAAHPSLMKDFDDSMIAASPTATVILEPSSNDTLSPAPHVSQTPQPEARSSPGLPLPLPVFPDLEFPKTTQTTELTQEAKLELWKERIQIMAEMLLHNDKVSMPTADIIDLVNYSTNDTFVTNLDEKQRIEANIEELSADKEVAERVFRKKLEVLVGSRTWPSLPLPEDIQAQNEKVKGYVNDLAKTTEVIKDLLTQSLELDESRKKTVGKGKVAESSSGTIAEDQMDVDSETVVMTEKRQEERRTVADDDEDSGSVPLRRKAELDEIRKNFASLRELWDHLRNSMDQREGNLMSGVKEMCHDMLEQKKKAVESFAQEQQRLIDTDTAGFKSSLSKVEEQITSTNEELAELTEIAKRALGQIAALRNERDSLLADGRQFFEHDLVRYKSQLFAYDQLRELDQKRYSALQSLVHACINRPPSPPQMPDEFVIDAPEYVMQSLRPQLLDVLRENVKPLMEEVRGRVEEMVKAQNAKVYGAARSMLQLTVGVLDQMYQDAQMEQVTEGRA